jgi:hypothetical protein
VAFAAGFIDAIVGGGSLLQTAAILLILPHYPVATLLGKTYRWKVLHFPLLNTLSRLSLITAYLCVFSF